MALLSSELAMLKNLDHPNIVHVVELLEDTRSFYFVMELIEHGNLEDVLDEISTTNCSFTSSDAANIIQ